MKVIYFSLLLFLISSCEKERCYTIEGKEIINGDYFFLLDNNRLYNESRSNNADSSAGIPDPYGTGKVDKETYDSVSVGEKYCG
tara:strand:+ start:258 stop:509 length:252 start_codon:yes stop_codon:yes gene_type:complete